MFLAATLPKKLKGTGKVHFAEVFHLSQYAQYRTDTVHVFKELAEETLNVGLIITAQRC